MWITLHNKNILIALRIIEIDPLKKSKLIFLSLANYFYEIKLYIKVEQIK